MGNDGHVVNFDGLPEGYPTHLHQAEFWEWLGRVVGTFGFLENTLARAIFAFSGTREYAEEDVQSAFAAWVPKLEKSLSDTLHPLIRAYEQEVLSHQHTKPEDFDALISDLKKAAELRNVLCHGSWSVPNAEGASVPFYRRSKDKMSFDNPVDVRYLKQTQKGTMELAAAVINTVTVMGYRFPGVTKGLGRAIF
jgi:kynureninase